MYNTTLTRNRLSSILREIAAAACSGAAYTKWSDDFARKEVSEVWKNEKASLRAKREFSFTVEELRQVDKDFLYSIGFANWDDSLLLFPLWVFHYIADGETLLSINGKISVKGRDEIDLDHRGGALACGFKH